MSGINGRERVCPSCRADLAAPGSLHLISCEIGYWDSARMDPDDGITVDDDARFTTTDTERNLYAECVRCRAQVWTERS